MSSRVYPFNYSNSSCGYCKGKDRSFSYSMWACALTCSDYQALINRGWRRSGCYLYKPDQRASCCAQYTIRLSAQRFQLDKTHRKTLKQFKKHIAPHMELPTSNQHDIHELCQWIDRLESNKSLTVTTVPARMDEEVYGIYAKYQKEIHHEPPSKISRRGFKRFLVDSPLKFEAKQNWPVPGLGSFHQLYRLNGRLIAVAVLDILPECVSSVYFMYDPEFSYLGLGKYSALRELTLVQKLTRCLPTIEYYYMGFYIHTCDKMRYKASYKPSDLLDPETYRWYPLSTFEPYLNQYKFYSFAPGTIPITSDQTVTSSTIPPGVRDWRTLPLEEMMGITIEYRHNIIFISTPDSIPSSLHTRIKKYIAFVGSHLARTMILVLPDYE